MRSKILLSIAAAVACIAAMPASRAAVFTASSPDGKLVLGVETGERTTWTLTREGRTVLAASELSLTLDDGTVWGRNVKKAKARTTRTDTSFDTPFYRRSKVRDNYTLLTLECKGYSVEFRVYDDAAAYRFVGNTKGTIKVKNEQVEYNFDKDYRAFVPYIGPTKGERYATNFETYYTEQQLSQMSEGKLSSIPLIVDLEGGMKATLLDVGYANYPSMFVKKNPDKQNSIISEFAGVPKGIVMEINQPTNLKTTKNLERLGYITETQGTAAMPWRVVVVTDNDTQLAECDITMKLSEPCRIDDTSWIKPGKAAWEWLHAHNIAGVDFKSGINTDTYKYYIDFASQFGVAYLIIDDGWKGKDIFEVKPSLNLPALVDYGKAKGVGLILWVDWDEILPVADKAFKHYSDLGVKGFKIDHIDNDDQPVVASLRELAKAAAEHKMIINYHGTKPMGLHRPYPNVMTYEGVKGLEQCKWLKTANGQPSVDFPRYDVTVPFGRMLVGPLDYTPGLMRNATRAGFRPVNDAPMSIGTRAHHMAVYTLFDSPLQIMGDAPQNYYKERECTEYIAAVPCVFDESRTLAAKVGEYILGARRKGDVWHAAAMTDWTARTLDVPLSFLGEGKYRATVFSDGVNADRNAEDYRKTVLTVTKNDVLKAVMQPGGGWNARFEKL